MHRGKKSFGDIDWKEDRSDETVAEVVADALREAVLNGTLNPGEKLREKAICDQMGISRTPLREAYRILQMENLLVYEPYVGVKVAYFSPTFLNENWDIRMVLEAHAARCCGTKSINVELAEFQTMLIAMRVADANNQEFENLDEAFHLLVARKSCNTALYNQIKHLWNITNFLRKISLYKAGRSQKSKEEHIAVLEAILDRDANRAHESMWNHLLNSKQDVETSDFFVQGKKQIDFG